MSGRRRSIFVFDAYGTLFDVHSAVARIGSGLGVDADAFSALWRAKQLEYSWVRTLMGRYRDFWSLTEEALDYCYARFPTADTAVRDDLLEAYATLDAYPDVRPELQTLRKAGCRTAILSNGTDAMLARAVTSAGLADYLDAVLSVDGLRQFKTVPAAYALVCERFAAAPDSISFQSSNPWDIAGAAAFGFRPVWINRGALPGEYADLAPRHVLPSLTGLSTLEE